MRVFKSGAIRSSNSGKNEYYGYRHPLLEKSGSLSELKYVWSRIPNFLKNNEEFISLKNNLKQKYEN